MNAAELTAQLRELYEATHIPPLGEDEFTVGMFAKANDCNPGTAARLLRQALDDGRLRYVGDRIHQRKRAAAYKFTEPA